MKARGSEVEPLFGQGNVPPGLPASCLRSLRSELHPDFHMSLKVLNLDFERLLDADDLHEKFHEAIRDAISAHIGDADRTRAEYAVASERGEDDAATGSDYVVDAHVLISDVRSITLARMMALKLKPPPPRLHAAIGKRVVQVPGLAQAARGGIVKVINMVEVEEPRLGPSRSPPPQPRQDSEAPLPPNAQGGPPRLQTAAWVRQQEEPAAAPPPGARGGPPPLPSAAGARQPEEEEEANSGRSLLPPERRGGYGAMQAPVDSGAPLAASRSVGQPPSSLPSPASLRPGEAPADSAVAREDTAETCKTQ